MQLDDLITTTFFTGSGNVIGTAGMTQLDDYNYKRFPGGKQEEQHMSKHDKLDEYIDLASFHHRFITGAFSVLRTVDLTKLNDEDYSAFCSGMATMNERFERISMELLTECSKEYGEADSFSEQRAGADYH